MIKAHYHRFKKRRCCHVYSDIGSHDELVAWAQAHHINPQWIQTKTLEHLDLWSMMLQMVTDVTEVSHGEFRKDLRRLKRRNRDLHNKLLV